MTIKKQAKPTEALQSFEVFYNGELFQTVEFSSLRKCNNWREKNLETPFLYVIKTPNCNRESCIELSKRYFSTKHRVYPELFERPAWDVVTEAELQQLEETRIVRENRERTGVPLSVQVGGGKYDVTIVHFDKPMRDRVEIIKGDLSREEAYEFIRNFGSDTVTKVETPTEEGVRPVTKMNQTERQQLILSTLLDTIKPENTGWRKIVKAIEALHVVEPDGWLEVRDVLQYALDQGRIARPKFDPHADDEYYFSVTPVTPSTPKSEE
ncbi:hypothetical protein BJ917_6151 [Pseudomonas sp. WPR_5_2]|uniref:hypothetical protein n=1 Tax=Pseudomonas sp. WPR_5_2 TaxID=1907371 RepID=UPI000EACB8DC|nr:hypothetical protein [Pseudomonas sp. WPR_5_2]RKS12233.1 hypothetical protein BJ917_6151 [Pseudomonas sp. WPR_5_2]